MNRSAQRLPGVSAFVGFLSVFFAVGLGIRDLPGQSNLPESVPPKLLESIRQVLFDTDTPGAGLVLVERGRLEWAGGVGYADVEAGRPATAATLFRIGSISEIFVALSVLRLQEKGYLGLQDPVRVLAPALGVHNRWSRSHPLTLDHLLEHTGGLDDLTMRESAHSAPTPISLREGLALRHPRPCRWPPGKFFSYSDAGPAMAAFVVEQITGQPFETHVRENWFDPLGMATSTFYPDRRLAKGYVKGRPVDYRHVALRASGAISSSPREMAALLLLLLNRGRYGQRQLLAPDSIHRMETPFTSLAAANGIRTGIGLCLDIKMLDGYLVRGHSGSIRGYRSRLEYFPQAGQGFALFINSGSADALSRSSEIVRRHLLAGLPRSEPPRSEIPAWRIAGLAGYYRPIAPRRELNRFLENLFGVIRLDLEGNHLRVSGQGADQVLIPVTDRRFRGPDDPIPSAVFVTDEGRMILQGTGPILPGSYQALSPWRLGLERAAAVTAGVLMLGGLLVLLWWAALWVTGSLQDRVWIHLVLLPALAATTMLLGTAGVVVALGDPVQRLGNLTFWSFSIFALSTLFAVFAVLGVLQSLRGLAWKGTRPGVRIFALACSSANLGVAVYLWSHGIVGLQTWIY